MPTRLRPFIAVALLLALPGCADIFPTNWCAPPGPASYQLAVAKKYDPFPDPNIAPEIMGGRPLGFREPRPEPDITKNRQFSPWMNSYGTAPAASYAPPFVPPVVQTYPPATTIAPPATAPPALVPVP